MTATVRSGLITLAVLATSVTAATTATATPTISSGSDHIVVAQGPLTDLQPATSEPLDGARAVLVMRSGDGATTVFLQVTGIDRTAAGRDFGAHLHVGPCVAGNGAAAGPHYNTDVLAGRVPPRVDATTEVWLDFTVGISGTATAIAEVPFVPVPGERSVVIHRDPTDAQGVAGPRLACLPVSW